MNWTSPSHSAVNLRASSAAAASSLVALDHKLLPGAALCISVGLTLKCAFLPCPKIVLVEFLPKLLQAALVRIVVEVAFPMRVLDEAGDASGHVSGGEAMYIPLQMHLRFAAMI